VVAPGFTVTMTAPRGAVYYTFDGTDPRLPGGAVSSSARIAPKPGEAGDANILQRSTLVKARSNLNSSWSALTEAMFLVDTGNLRVTELMYHPPRDSAADTFDREEYEFIEVQNIGERPLNLLGLRFTEGIHFDFRQSKDPSGDLPPGEATVVVK